MKNKIITLSIILLLFSFVFVNNNVFAYETTYNQKNFCIPDEILDIAKNLDEYEQVGTTYDLFVWQDGWSSSHYYYIYFATCGGCLYDTARFNGSSARELKLLNCSFCKCYVYDTSFNYKFEDSGFYQFTYLVENDTELVYSTVDIYTDSTCTDFFFKAPVTEIPEKIPGTLGEIMNKAGELATQEITQIILIVIMITAGLTVLLIGLRKGLKVLMNGFRH